MTVKEAISVMLQAAEIGRQKAAYSFDDAALISQAIHALTDLAAKLPDETAQQVPPASGDGIAVQASEAAEQPTPKRKK